MSSVNHFLRLQPGWPSIGITGLDYLKLRTIKYQPRPTRTKFCFSRHGQLLLQRPDVAKRRDDQRSTST